MALLVRPDLFGDGNGLVTLAEADAFHEARGNVAWAELSDDAKASHIIAADDYIYSVNDPVEGVEGIPQDVKSAVAFLALQASAGPLVTLPASDAGVSSGAVRSMSRSIGSLRTSTTYESTGSASSGTIKRWPQVDGWLGGSFQPKDDSLGGITTVFAGRF